MHESRGGDMNSHHEKVLVKLSALNAEPIEIFRAARAVKEKD